MGFMIIDGRKVEFSNEKNVLAVIRKAGIDLPTLCYKPELSTFGGCRMCMVEDSRGKMFASCSERPKDGMEINTNTARLIQYRKTVIELLLAAHNRDCTTCAQSGHCKLQDLAQRYGVRNVRFENYKEEMPLDFSSPSIIRDPNKCILCGNCVRVCTEIQSVGALGYINRGSDSTVEPAFGKPLAETDCVNCGQCRVACPVGAITIHSNVADAWAALNDPKKRVICQIAPSVRVAVGNEFGLPNGESVIGKLVTALRAMGFDQIYDTNFTADLTIMEESAEFLDRVANGGKLPLLTSCCPAWVKFVGDQYPDYTENVSTCRSPQGMMSPVIKAYYNDPKNNPEGKETFVISIMPCTAKKMEANRPNSYTDGVKDTDLVLTTTEIVEMIKTTGMDFVNLESQAADNPFGLGSGGGVIFGNSGGVTEAVIRRLTDGNDKVAMAAIADCGVRQDSGIREFSIPYNGIDVQICVASGLANARQVMDSVKNGEKTYHLIEIMACPGGCINGGGQPKLTELQTVADRTAGIFEEDRNLTLKKCDENPYIISLYDGLLKGQEHHLLHNEEFCAK